MPIEDSRAIRNLPVILVTSAGSDALTKRYATNYVPKQRNYLPKLLQRVNDALTRGLFRKDHRPWLLGSGVREVVFQVLYTANGVLDVKRRD